MPGRLTVQRPAGAPSTQLPLRSTDIRIMRILCLALALSGTWARPAAAGPAPISTTGPADRDASGPLPRAPANERRPLEVVGGARLFAPLCATTGDACDQGVAFGGVLAALQRTSPFFAWGAEGHYLETGDPTLPSGTWRRTLEVSVVGRVYLEGEGALDPYLELALGYAWERERWTANGPAASSRRGPSARVGGGVDAALGGGLEAGFAFAYREDLLGPEPHCGAGLCPGTALVVRGGVLVGLTLSLSFGDPL